ncbi:bifunctional diaminohydroxyphosphoribosylaminopyrimidine deaminase/5-amino-6-(5-phosphoribosylamino)uracil reductase RibD [Croceibacter atlanticus]|uniref:bifunctional diaminohydroxyphosphoribosylaminopyrimidine deaminase/5-amino-6-(5-phosphoribosylamino)uracil reductase RibD n=1 Tax=Croceibacter atlanticus TaxID=313588 RepID=UPI0030DD0E91
MNSHKTYIKRCLQLAKKGLGTTYPNPMVGSVIVYDNKIIGEGWHQKAGLAHAEVNAINAVKDKSLLKKSTIYVSLEPCSHYGKTPPCADLIIANNIPNVVIGTVDPFAKVKGQGIKKLLDAGCKITVGVLEDECQELNKRFFTFHNSKRPYIILKWAESNDAFLAPKTKHKQQPVWITNLVSRQLVHKWRAEEQAILVGTKTVKDDNPSLTTRDWSGSNPTRLVIDRNNVLDKSLSVFNDKAETVVFSENTSNFNNLPQHICEYCHTNNLQSIIVEGGAQTLQHFINANLWDEARVFKGDVMFYEGTKAPLITGSIIHKETLQNDTLTIYTNS